MFILSVFDWFFFFFFVLFFCFLQKKFPLVCLFFVGNWVLHQGFYTKGVGLIPKSGNIDIKMPLFLSNIRLSDFVIHVICTSAVVNLDASLLRYAYLSKISLCITMNGFLCPLHIPVGRQLFYVKKPDSIEPSNKLN